MQILEAFGVFGNFQTCFLSVEEAAGVCTVSEAFHAGNDHKHESQGKAPMANIIVCKSRQKADTPRDPKIQLIQDQWDALLNVNANYCADLDHCTSKSCLALHGDCVYMKKCYFEGARSCVNFENHVF
eukprot:419654-Pelagomonas_calceolata.AAC.6